MGKHKMIRKKDTGEFPLIIPEYYHTSQFNLEIRNSQIKGAGFGVFTNNFIPKNTFIDYYQGLLTKYSISMGRYYFKINDEYGVEAYDYPRCYMAMLNDSYNSSFQNNCEFIVDEVNMKVSIFSIYDILPNQELFISYGSEYWK
jgi:SET domain-containing protein